MAAIWLFGSRMDGFGYGAGLGTGSSHHRTMGSRLWLGRACRLDFRAVRGFPPALGEAQQAALKGAVQELPAAGIGMANWNWRWCTSLSRNGSASA